MRLYGIDFTSAPRRAKAIVVAQGRPAADRAEAIRIESLQCIESLAAFEHWLGVPGPWVGAFDLPFGLPRALMAEWQWCDSQPSTGDPDWSDLIQRLAAFERPELIGRLRAYCDARPAGHKFAHRVTDGPAGSSPSMKWVNPPVALMLHAGVPRLLRAGLQFPGLHPAGDGAWREAGEAAQHQAAAPRIALEAYPGMVAHLLAGRASYKSDDRARQTPERAAVRRRLVEQLEAGPQAGSDHPDHPDQPAPSVAPAFLFRLEVPVRMAPDVRQACLADASGDALDAVMGVVLADWAWRRRGQGWGLRPDCDPLEGWIVGA